MRVALVVVAVSVASALGSVGCAKPAKVIVDPAPPSRVQSLQPIKLAAPVVKDQNGKVLDVTPTVTVTPPGLVEVDGLVLKPHARGDVVVTVRAGDASASFPLEVRPVTRVALRCVPSCRVALGESATVQATAYSGDELLLDIEPTLTAADASALVIDGARVTGKAPGAVKVHGAVGDVGDDVVIDVRPKITDVAIHCPTVYTVSKADDGTTTNVCYFTQGTTAQVRAAALAGGKEEAAHVDFDVVNKDIAEVTPGGEVVPKQAGLTALKAALSDNVLVFGQIGVYVDRPRALERLFTSRALGRLYVAGGAVYDFYSPRCPSWKNFQTKAFSESADGPPTEIECVSSEAVACVAEASHALTRFGRMSDATFRGWLGPCCCITAHDRDELAANEKKATP